MNSSNKKISSNEKKLHNAVASRNIVNIMNLLKRDVDIEAVDPYGNTVIHLVFRDCNSNEIMQQQVIEILKIFLDRGIDPNSQNAGAFTPLHLAVVNRMRHVVKFLLDHQANLHAKDANGNTLLHYFVKSEFEKLECYEVETENTEVIKAESAGFLRWLASVGFKLDCKNNSGWTPLHLAVQYNLQHIILILLVHTHDLDLNDKLNKTLLHRFFEAHTKLKKPCIRFGDFSLFLCNTRYTTGIVKGFLSRKVSVDAVNEEQETALHYAINLKLSVDILELIVEKFTAVHATDIHGKTVLDLFIDLWWKDSGVDTYLRFINTLITKGADISRRNSNGLTPIQQAVTKNNFDLLLLLKEGGADMSVRTEKGENLLHLAHSDERTIEYLVTSGVDINGSDNDGVTPLHAEVWNRSSLKVKALLKYGANVDLLDSNGFSILRKAICQRNLPMVKELLKYGVDMCDYEILEHFQVIDNEVRGCLLKHIVKMSAARVPGIEDCERALGELIFCPFRQECRKEMLELKKYFIDEKTSLLDFLRMDPNRRCVYVKNVKLEAILNNADYGHKFPNYFVLLLGSYLQTVRRKFLLRPAERAWYSLTRIYIPHLCVDRILAHMSNVHLMLMIKTNRQPILKRMADRKKEEEQREKRPKIVICLEE